MKVSVSLVNSVIRKQNHLGKNCFFIGKENSVRTGNYGERVEQLLRHDYNSQF